MNLTEFITMLNSALDYSGDDRVKITDKNSGMIFDIQDVVSEVHEDADGSTTHWIQVEEH